MLAVGASVPDPNGRTLYLIILANPGNGTEAYDIAAREIDAAISRIVIDADGDGKIGGGHTPLDARTPPLVPGGVFRLLIEADPTGAVPDILFTARAVTGSGAPGLALDGRGDGSGDAVVGRTGAAVTVSLLDSTSVPRARLCGSAAASSKSRTGVKRTSPPPKSAAKLIGGVGFSPARPSAWSVPDSTR